MNWFKKIKNMFTRSNTRREEISFSDPKLIDYLVGSEEVSEAVFSVVAKLSNTFATLPLKMIDSGYKHPNDCQAYNIMKNGPGYLTRFDFFRDVETIRNLQGNAYVQLFKDISGQIVSLKLIKPGACSPVLTEDGELYYHVQSDTGKSMYVHYLEILHFKHIRLGGGILGTNPLNILSNSLAFDEEVQKISLKQLKGTNEGIKVKFSTNMNEEDKKNTINQIANFYRENGGLIVEENGVEIERIKRELIDTKLLEIDSITKSKIAMVYNVPEHFLSSGKKDSYNSQEQLNMEFLTYNLLSTVTQYEEELNKKTLTHAQQTKGYRYKFNVSGLLRADTKTRGAFYQIMRRAGAYSANEVRLLEDQQPSEIHGMNDYHISGDLYPIDMDPSQRKLVRKAGDE